MPKAGWERPSQRYPEAVCPSGQPVEGLTLWLELGDEGSADPVEGLPGWKGFCLLPDPMEGAESKLVTHKPQDEYSNTWEETMAAACQRRLSPVRAMGQRTGCRSCLHQSLISRHQGHSEMNASLCFSSISLGRETQTFHGKLS